MPKDGYFLLFNSKHIVSLEEGKIEDGEAQVGQKSFVVDKTEPFFLKKENFLGQPTYYPLYFVKWDDPQPKTLGDLENLDGVDIQKGDITPELQKRLAETKLLKGLFNQSAGLSDDTKQKLILVLVTVATAAVGLYLMYHFGYLG